MPTNTAYINNEVYAIINDVHKMATGAEEVAVVDTASFVDFGNNVLSSSDATETFLNTYLLRIAQTYDTFRPYDGKLKDLMLSGSEWGAIVQKIDAEVPDFVSDETFEITDGQSVDQYIVRKPVGRQKLFIKRSTYSNFITTAKKLLKGAFLSEAAFLSWARMVAGKMRNKIEFATENLARLAIANYIANCADNQIVHLLTNYNAESGLSLTADKALLDKDFLAYAAGEMELVSKRLRNLSVSYNAEEAERHTPAGEQRFLVFDKFQSRLQHVVQYQAYHKELVSLGEFIEVPYWQGEYTETEVEGETVKVDARDTIIVTVDDGDGGTESKTVAHIMGFIFDKYALGAHRSEEETLTTPINARGRYYNTFHFAEQLWFNDLSENGVVFLLD